MLDRKIKTTYYVNSIIKDIQNQFIREETTSFSDSKIERQYEFPDGAIVKYEWQNEDSARKGESFNHRFSLIKLPEPNEGNFELGIIKIVNY
ncbi:MAG: hypothetical protein K1X72_25450 [Pyrinomonadaceae bacterium]|nr:hypothetical protein [Pyrinomonadaceae bacterium]